MRRLVAWEVGLCNHNEIPETDYLYEEKRFTELTVLGAAGHGAGLTWLSSGGASWLHHILADGSRGVVSLTGSQREAG